MSRAYFGKGFSKYVLAGDLDLLGACLKNDRHFLNKYTRLAQPLHFTSCGEPLLVEGKQIRVLIASLRTNAIMFRVSSAGDSVAGRVFPWAQRQARTCVSPVKCDLSASGPQIALGT
jgi:hypothetical protein